MNNRRDLEMSNTVMISQRHKEQCTGCTFVLNPNANLLVAIDTFKSMLRHVGYNILSLNIDGNDEEEEVEEKEENDCSSSQISLRLILGKREIVHHGRKRLLKGEKQGKIKRRKRKGNEKFLNDRNDDDDHDDDGTGSGGGGGGGGGGCNSCVSCASLCYNEKCTDERCEEEGCLEKICGGICGNDNVQEIKGIKEIEDVQTTNLLSSVFECDSCTNMFPSEEILNYHLLQEHGKSNGKEKNNGVVVGPVEENSVNVHSTPSSLGNLPDDAPSTLLTVNSSATHSGGSGIVNGNHTKNENNNNDKNKKNKKNNVEEAEKDALHFLVGVQEADTNAKEFCRLGLSRDRAVAPCCRRDVSHYPYSQPTAITSCAPTGTREKLMTSVHKEGIGPLLQSCDIYLNEQNYSRKACSGNSPMEKNNDRLPNEKVEMKDNKNNNDNNDNHDSSEFKLQERLPNGRIPCQIKECHQTFGRASTARRHFLRKHSKVVTYKCEYCSKELADKGTLRIHIQGVHEKKRPWQCEICETKFTQSSSLHRHYRDIHKTTAAKLLNSYDA